MSRRRAIGLGLALVLAATPVALAAVEPNLRDLAFTPLAPCRVLDSRPGSGGPGEDGPLAPSALYSIDVAGVCGVPPEAKAVVLNLVAVAPAGAGHLVLWPWDSANTSPPNASAINFVPGNNIANGLVVPLCDEGNATDNSGADCDHSLLAMAGISAVDLVADVLGYFSAPGDGPLWGEGRSNAERFGRQAGQFEFLCSAGELLVGLSRHMVEFADAATACPAGTWVCNPSEVSGMGACDTSRPDSDCDQLDCDGECVDMPPTHHEGWGEGIGSARLESGGSSFTANPCGPRPVWCCSR